ncbi:MAG: hypothetical protein KDA91_24095 [Planctomycetaceae bacterium]|nr:hypothetical protein [Planctomycetaceae bacterium]
MLSITLAFFALSQQGGVHSGDGIPPLRRVAIDKLRATPEGNLVIRVFLDWSNE